MSIEAGSGGEACERPGVAASFARPPPYMVTQRRRGGYRGQGRVLITAHGLRMALTCRREPASEA